MNPITKEYLGIRYSVKEPLILVDPNSRSLPKAVLLINNVFTIMAKKTHMLVVSMIEL